MRSAMSPAVIAETVVAALGTDRFWLLTHPELNEGMRQRAASIEASLP